MGQQYKYKTTGIHKNKWYCHCKIIKGGKSVASGNVYAKKKGPALDWPKILQKNNKNICVQTAICPQIKTLGK